MPSRLTNISMTRDVGDLTMLYGIVYLLRTANPGNPIQLLFT